MSFRFSAHSLPLPHLEAFQLLEQQMFLAVVTAMPCTLRKLNVEAIVRVCGKS